MAIKGPDLVKALFRLDPVDADTLAAARRIAASGEEVARAYILDRAARMCVVDGTLMEPCPEPVWRVLSDHSTRTPRVDVFPSFDLGGSHVRQPAFPADALDEAMAHAAWMASEPRRAVDGAVPTRLGAIRPGPAFRAGYDPVVAGGAAVMAEYYGARQGEAFHRLPRACLAAWLDFRDALDPALGGDGGAVAAGMAALARFAAALPGPAEGDGDGFWVARNDLPSALRVFERALARRAASGLAADEESLAGLVAAR